jgi:HEAT repeat protein
MLHTDYLLSELKNISPMPDDVELNEAILKKYEKLIRDIILLKDPRFITPLVNSFGYGEGFGLYWSVLHFLEEFTVEQVDPILIKCLRFGEKGPKMWAAYMLGRSRNTDAVNILINLLNDENELTRVNTAIALGMIGESKVRHFLEKSLNDPSERVRDAVKKALENLSE